MRKIPFPQANNIELIYEMFCNFESMGMSKFDIERKYNIVNREGSYYLDALYYLGVLEKIQIKYFLNQKGSSINGLIGETRKKEFMKLIVNHYFLGNLFTDLSAIRSQDGKRSYLISQIAEHEHLCMNTAKRRASTITSWFNWIDKQMKEVGNINDCK